MNKIIKIFTVLTIMLSPLFLTTYANAYSSRIDMYNSIQQNMDNNMQDSKKSIVTWDVQTIKLSHIMTNDNFYNSMNNLAKITNNELLYSNQVSDIDEMPIMVLNKSLFQKVGDNYELIPEFNTIFKESTTDNSFLLKEGVGNSTYIDMSKYIKKAELTRSILLHSTINNNKINTSLYIRSFLTGVNPYHHIGSNNYVNKNELQLIQYGKDFKTNVLNGNYDINLNSTIIVKVNGSDLLLLTPIQIVKNTENKVNSEISISKHGNYKINTSESNPYTIK